MKYVMFSLIKHNWLMQRYTGSGYFKFTSIKHLYDILVMFSEKITHNVIAELIVRLTTNGHRASTISTNLQPTLPEKGVSWN